MAAGADRIMTDAGAGSCKRVVMQEQTEQTDNGVRFGSVAAKYSPSVRLSAGAICFETLIR